MTKEGSHVLNFTMVMVKEEDDGTCLSVYMVKQLNLKILQSKGDLDNVKGSQNLFTVCDWFQWLY